MLFKDACFYVVVEHNGVLPLFIKLACGQVVEISSNALMVGLDLRIYVLKVGVLKLPLVCSSKLSKFSGKFNVS